MRRGSLTALALVLTALALVLTGALAAGCMAQPPAARVQDDKAAEAAPPDPTSVRLATDLLQSGFNPYVAGEDDPMSALVTELTLPGAVRPAAPQPARSGEENSAEPVAVAHPLSWDFDPSIVVAAAVTSQSPFTVAYTLAPNAQWGSNPPLPVGASDFDYVRRLQTTAPGVSGVSGYDLIHSIRDESVQGKARVVVEFERPYPGWRELFPHLLPSRILPDPEKLTLTGNPLVDGVPTTAGPMRVHNLDVARGRIDLRANDRYAASSQQTADTLVIDRVTDPMSVSRDLASSALDGAILSKDPLGTLRYAQAGDVAATYELRPRRLDLTANTTSPVLRTAALRREVLGLIDVDVVAQVAVGRPGSGRLTAGDAVQGAMPVAVAGSFFDDTPHAPAPDTDGAKNKRASQKLRRVATKDHPLVLGVARSHQTARAGAYAVAQQLTAAGVPTTVVESTWADLTGRQLPEGWVDLVVGWSETSRSHLDRSRGAFGCDTSRPIITDPEAPETPRQRGSASEGDGTSSTSSTSSTPASTPTSTSASSSTSTAPTISGVATLAGRAENLSGVCSPEIDAVLDEWMTAVEGDDRVAAARSEELIDRAVSGAGLVLPLVHDTVLQAASPQRRSVLTAGTYTGIGPRASTWRDTASTSLGGEDTEGRSE